MKSKLLILFVFGWIGLFAQSVPNTNTFSLQTVVGVVGGDDLQEVFSLSVDSYFDPAYKGDKSNLLNFRNYTIPSISIPTVVSPTYSNLASTHCDGSGNVSSDGGGAITERGVCWSTTSGTETATGNHATIPGTTGVFTAYMTSLSPSTTYYMKMYAKNSAGTGYSGELSFTTQPVSLTYTSSGSWTCPSGVSSVTVECIGGGGAGGPATGNPSRAGGGAGGSYARSVISVTVTTNYAIRVAASSTASTSIQVNGDYSAFNSSTVVAVGGLGGSVSSGAAGSGGGPGSGSVGTVTHTGGSGGNGTSGGVSGGGGGSAASGSNGNSATAGTPGSSISPYSGAGGAGVTTSNTRNAGGSYGGGGSGGLATSSTDRAGGNGAGGIVILSFP